MQPGDPRDDENRFEIERGNGGRARLLELPNAPLDFFNARLPDTDRASRDALRELCRVPRMCSLPIGAVINRAVRSMPDDHVYVNVGVWNGFTLLCGTEGNPGRTCIGVDNFSEGPGERTRRALASRLEALAGPDHRFYEMDYREYFENVHREQIGVYLYDGEHSYENQLLGLQIAEPYLAEGAIVLVDDTNWESAHRGTLDFVASSPHEYRVLMDSDTAGNAHPTWSNGLIVLQLARRAPDAPAARVDRGTGHRPEESSGARHEPILSERAERLARPARRIGAGARGTLEPSLVSVVVHNDQDDGGRLAAALDGYLHQTWPNVELVVANDSRSEDVARALVSFAGRVSRVDRTDEDGESALSRAVAATTGDFVAIADPHGGPIHREAIRFALAFPGRTGRGRELPPRRIEWMEQALHAADEIAAAVPEGETLLLVNEQLWSVELTPSRHVIPFPSRDGVYWGLPLNNPTAISELERMRASGAAFIAFAWPAFWWLDHYSGFHSHLRAAYECIIENSDVVVFDLRESALEDEGRGT